MKKLMLCVFILVTVTNINLYSQHAKTNNDTLLKIMKVTKIINQKKAYLIEVQDTICYTIVSLKTQKKNKQCNLIEIGKSYKFIVIPYFESIIIPRPELCILIEVEDEKLKVPLIGSNIFFTLNLKGLCYTENVLLN